ncbi:MAG: carboxymuconolactone decarboxylase family protein, partial [Archaeoglobaceae archaeon]
AMGEFSEFMDKVLEEGHLDLKTKELIALTNGITARCKYCIDIHTQKALQAGATREEILEAAFVAIMMGGGHQITLNTGPCRLFCLDEDEFVFV